MNRHRWYFNNLVVFLVVGLCIIDLGACTPRIRLPKDNSLKGEAQWLVIVAPYGIVKENPTITSKQLGMVRRGTVLQVIESAFSADERDKGTLWFKIQNEGIVGWVASIDVHTYSNERDAERAARELP